MFIRMIRKCHIDNACNSTELNSFYGFTNIYLNEILCDHTGQTTVYIHVSRKIRKCKLELGKPKKLRINITLA